MPDDDFPFVLNTGRLQHQWHTMTKTGKVAKLNKLNPGPFVEIHPDDAAALGIADGDPVEIASRRGRAVLPAVVTDRVRPGNCFAPFHWNDVFGEYLTINAVTNDAVDPISLQPEFKVCAVTLTKVAVVAPDSGAELPVAPRPESAAAGAPRNQRGPGRCPRRIAAVWQHEPAPEFDPLGRSTSPGSWPGCVRRRSPAPPGCPSCRRARRSNRHPAVGRRPAGRDRSRARRTPPASPIDGAGRQPGNRTPAPPMHRERAPIVVLWASQTGNAEEFAADVATRLAEAGLPVALHSMADFPPAELPATRPAGHHQHLRRRRSRPTTAPASGRR